ncbi:hypothetical protein ABT075_44955 [Streptomyces sp. NPDC002677]|uniref:hypothetical protein n=1 Tax=Streptomyces sp. NPDC002677 TaxID=3154774 RepID=UPI0033281480
MPNPYAVLSAVGSGAGNSALPRSLCQEYPHSGRLVLRHDPARVRACLRAAAHCW